MGKGIGLTGFRNAGMPRELTPKRHGAFLVCSDPTDISPETIALLLTDPDRFFVSGQAIQSRWQSAATDKVVATLGGKTFFLKRYNCLGYEYRLKNFFRQSRAMKSWWAGWMFLQRGVPTPRPLCCMEERRLRLLGRSYLVYEFIDGASSLLDLWPALDTNQRGQVLRQTGREIGRMHRCGLLHGDLNWRNIMVRILTDGVEVSLVDLDGSCSVRQLSQERAQRDLSHFFRDLQRNDASADETRLFKKTWGQVFLAARVVQQ